MLLIPHWSANSITMSTLLLAFVICTMTSASSTKKVVESKQVIDQAVGKAPHTATKQYTDRAVYHGQYSGEYSALIT